MHRYGTYSIFKLHFLQGKVVYLTQSQNGKSLIILRVSRSILSPVESCTQYSHFFRRSTRLTIKMLLPMTTLTALCVLFDFSKSTDTEKELEDKFKAR